MNCRRAEKILSAYMDHELKPRDRAKIERHLDSCGACREKLEEFRADWEVLEALPGYEIPAGMKARVIARLPVKEAADPRWTERLSFARPALASSLIALVAGVTLGIFVGQGLYTHALATDSSTSAYETISLDDFTAAPPDSLADMFPDFLGEGETG
jgi:anti-sigma factor RsiW